MRLRLKLFLPLIVFSLLFAAYAKWIWLPGLIDFIQEENKKHYKSHLRSVSESLVPLLLQQQLANVHDTLDSLLEVNPHWKRIYLYNKKGRLLYPIGVKKITDFNEKLMVFRRDIVIYTRKIGSLELVLDNTSYLNKLKRFENYFILVLAILLCLIVISIAALLDWIVSWPIKTLSLASEKLANGDYSAKLPKHQSDEVGNLVKSFKSMRDALDRYKSQVEQEISGHKETTAELRQEQERLAYHAMHDSLTGLLNRSEFDVRLKSAIETAYTQGAEHSILFIDMDRFKMVNDSCGHLAGDELLKQMGTLIRHQVRDTDSIARLGGDEFSVLLEHCSEKVSEKIIRNLHARIQEMNFSWDDRVISVGASIGMTFINRNTADMHTVFTAADRACYMAKKEGRNRYFIHRPGKDDGVAIYKQSSMVSNIVKSLEADRFTLYAQAIQSLRQDGDLRDHYEVLVRMLDDEGNIIMPADFIPVAERYNLMPKVDKWVLKNTLLALQELNASGFNSVSLSINLSGISMSDAGLLSYINEQFGLYDVQASDICFEITETAAISDITNAKVLIAELKKIGCEFSLDDFGSGFSSFSYLKNLAVDYLKIDGVFVQDITKDPVNYAMVQSIHDIGKVLGMKTIAEFVESAAISAKIKDIGVDYAQGYHIARPSPLLEVVTHNKVKVSSA